MEDLLSPTPGASDLVGLRQGLRVCFSSKYAGKTNTASGGLYFDNHMGHLSADV